MHVRLLGAFEVTLDGRAVDLGGRKQRTVLAALLTDLGRTVSVDRLVDAVWRDDPPSSADSSLQAYVSNLRRVLEPDRAPRSAPTILVTRPGGYALDLPPDSLDCNRFTALVRSARDAVDTRGDGRRHALGAYDDALALWAEPLGEFAHEPFADGLRLRLADLHAAAVEERAELLLGLGAHDTIIGELEGAVADEPLRERRWHQLALARYRAGQQTEALRALARARQTLADEAGLDPGPDLVQLEADILSHAPALDAPPPPSDPAPAAPPPPTDDRPAGDPAPGRSSLRGAAGRTEAPPRPLLGRSTELTEILAALDAAASGTGRVVVISGEPGIGKTRLAEELARAATDRGIAVGWARCPESAATAPLRPLLEVGEALAAEGFVQPFESADLAAVPSGSEEQDLIGPFVDAVRDLRRSDRTLVAVIDDAQWADALSLRVLEHTAGDLRDAPILVVLTTRPLEPGAPAALVDCLGELARQPGAVRLSLGGIDADAVDAWISTYAASRAERSLVEFVHDRTGGNPFFVQELVALLSTEDRLNGTTAPGGRTGRGAGVPDAVADVIRRRVGRLPAATQQLLPLVAVVGRAFDADVAAAVSGRSTAELLDDLDPAIGSGLVVEDAEVIGRFRFSHALVSEALVAELSPARRARSHAAATRAIEALRIGSLDEHVSEIAHHALAGALAGTGEQAVRYATLAAERAESVGAHEDAASHRAAVLRALELVRPGDRMARYEALVRYGIVLRLADDAAGAIDAFGDAVAIAEDLGDVDLMAAAAVNLNESTTWQSGDYGSDNAAESAVVERVLRRLPEADSEVRAELMGALANFLYYRDPQRCSTLADEAVAMARRLDRPATLLRTLNNLAQAQWRAGTLWERAATVREMVAVARAHDVGPTLRFVAEFNQLVAGLELGEPPRDHLDRLRALASVCRSATPLNQLDWFEAGWLAVEGRQDEAIALGQQTLERYRRTRRWGAGVVHFGAVMVARLDSGDGEQMLAEGMALDVGEYADTYVGLSAWALSELDQLELARALLGPEGSLPELRDDWLWLTSNTMLAHPVSAMGDQAAARVLYDRLSPFAGLIACAGTNPIGCTVDHALGRLAATLGDVEAARAHLGRAIEIEAGAGSIAWSTRARLARSELLRHSDHAADRRTAEADLELVRQVATRCRLVPVLARLDRLDDTDRLEHSS